jgi:probable F420-dependent oxidoreductase
MAGGCSLLAVPMKVRIGVGLGASVQDGVALREAVRTMERCGFDSLWLSEVLTTPVVDPLAGLAFAAGVTSKLKLGTTLTVTARNPVRLAKELATLDRFSGGRLLLVFVPGLAEPQETQALGVPVKERGAWIEEALPLLRQLWSADNVSYAGRTLQYDGLTVEPKPVQQPLEVWLGGTAPSALLRAGRFADGWLPSLCTPEEAAAGRRAIDAAAYEAGRQIDPEHFGISLSYAAAGDAISPTQVARIARRRPGLDPARVLPVGWTALRSLLQQYIDVGFSKFVIRPAEASRVAWQDELPRLSEAVLDLQTR